MVKIVEHLWAVGAPPGTPHSSPPDRLAGGNGVAAPFPRTPSPAVGLPSCPPPDENS